MTERRPRIGKFRISRAAWIVCGLVFLVPLVGWGLRQVRTSEWVGDWVSASHPEKATYQWFRQHFPGTDPVLIGWADSSLDDPRIPAVLDEVLGRPDDQGVRHGGMSEVSRIQTPHELIEQVAATARISRSEAIQRLQGVLVGPGALRIRLTDEARPHQAQLAKAMQAQAAQFLKFPVTVVPAASAPLQSGEPTAAAETETARDDSAEKKPAGPAALVISPDAWQTWAPHDLVVRWQGLRPKTAELEQFERLLGELRIPDKSGRSAVASSFFLPGSPIGLAVELTEAGRTERVQTLEKLKAAVARAGVPAAAIHVSGREALGAALDEAIPRVAWNPSVAWFQPQRSLLALCLVGGALLAFSLLRNLRLTAFVLLISYGSTLAVVALVPILGNWPLWQTVTGSSGQFHMLLVLMPPLLLSLTLAGAIDIANDWQRSAARNLRMAALHTFRTSLRPSAWSAAVIALGMLALLISPLQPVRDFGLYSAIGAVLTSVLTVFGLPALLRLFPPSKPAPEDLEPAGWQAFARGIVRRRWEMIAALTLLGAGTAAGLTRFRAETKPIRSFAAEAAVVRDYAWLEREVAGTVPVEIVVRFDREAQTELKLLQRADRIRAIEKLLREVPEISGTISLADFLPHVDDPGRDASATKRRQYLARCREAEENLGSQPMIAAYLATAKENSSRSLAGDELWRITAHWSMTSDAAYGVVLPRLDRACREVLRTVSGQGGPTFHETGREILFHPGASHVITGGLPLLMATQEELLRSLVASFGLACGLIGIALMIQLRSVPAGILALIPSVLPTAAVFGALSWLEIPTSLTTMITASLALGLGVDQTVHLITGFQSELHRRKNRREATVAALERCGPAIWETGLVLGIGLCVLVPSELLVISRFGLFMASLVGASVIADILLTPALLAGPLGWMLDGYQRIVPEPAKVVEPADSSDSDSEHSGLRIDDSRTPSGPHILTPETAPPRIVRM